MGLSFNQQNDYCVSRFPQTIISYSLLLNNKINEKEQKLWLLLMGLLLENIGSCITLYVENSTWEGNGTPLQYSCLENPMDGGAWWAAIYEVAQSRTWLSDFTLSFHFMHWRRKWQPTPVFLPGESQGQGSLMGCHLWGYTESDMTEVT